MFFYPLPLWTASVRVSRNNIFKLNTHAIPFKPLNDLIINYNTYLTETVALSLIVQSQNIQIYYPEWFKSSHIKLFLLSRYDIIYITYI